MGILTPTCNDVAMPRPKTGETPKRNIRIPDHVWVPAGQKAKGEGRTVAAVVNSSLARYIADAPDDAPAADPWDVVNHIIRAYGGGQVGPGMALSVAVDAIADAMRALGIRPEQDGE